MVDQDNPTTFSTQTKRVVITSAYKVRFVDDSTYTYVGIANPGTATSAASWQIKRVKNSNGDVDWAGGDTLFNNIWDDYSGLSYS
ncbi:hypothetical protein LCGC14_2959750 [marine sediment metagenome]|uniref:Uncharacterized protein n=1 Tax=marine sediment metagenome TaxID=412755 RepID=A0A0F8XDI1_9ZZZZ